MSGRRSEDYHQQGRHGYWKQEEHPQHQSRNEPKQHDGHQHPSPYSGQKKRQQEGGRGVVSTSRDEDYRLHGGHNTLREEVVSRSNDEAKRWPEWSEKLVVIGDDPESTREEVLHADERAVVVQDKFPKVTTGPAQQGISSCWEQ